MIGGRRASATGRPAVPRGERVLAEAVGTEQSVVGTRDALYLPDRLPWERIATAGWDRDGGRLRVVEQAGWGAVPTEHVVALSDASRLLQLIRERITASVVLQRSVEIRTGATVRVIGRRAPHGTAPIAWFVEYDEALDPRDPDVQARVEDELARARGDVGA